MESAINQRLWYANLRRPEDNEGCEKLFYYDQTMISTHRDKTRMGTISLAWTLSGMERSLSFVGREVRE